MLIVMVDYESEEVLEDWHDTIARLIPLNIEVKDSKVERIAPSQEEIDLEDYLIKKLKQGKIG